MSMLAGARQGSLRGLRGLTARAMARDLRAFVIPGIEVAQANGLDLRSAGVRLAANPREANVLVVLGSLPEGLWELAATVYAQMPRPRALLVLGGEAPVSLPRADAADALSQKGLCDGLQQVSAALAQGAFDPEPSVFAPDFLQRSEHSQGEGASGHEQQAAHGHGGEHGRGGDEQRGPEESPGAEQGEEDPGHHDHGGMGFMSMVEMTKDLPRSRDGLAMDRIEVPFGPFFPGLPGGLRLMLTLDGDGVAEARADSLAIASLPLPASPGRFVESLAAAMPLEPTAYRLLACRALECAVGLTPSPEAVRSRIGALEHERVVSHLGWLAQLGRQVGFEWAMRRAGELQSALRTAGPQTIARHKPALQALAYRLRRTSLLRARLTGIGRLASEAGLRGPVARASGMDEDARLAEQGYRALGFVPVIADGGDALARLCVRLGESVHSLDLVEAAGVTKAPTTPGIGSASGRGESAVETPRGRALLRLTVERGEVTRAALDLPSRDHRHLIHALVAERELGDALTAVGSLDLSPWEASV